MRRELPIATGFYEDSSRPISSQECANWFVQIPETNALSDAQLKPTPGISQFANISVRSSRGAHVMGGVMYAVNGDQLYRVSSSGVGTALGTITGAGPVSMDDNGTQLCIVVPGGNGYIFTASPDTLTQISDTEYTTNIGPSQGVVHHGGYFVHFNSNSAAGSGKVFFISNLRNGLAYDSLDFADAEVDPDKITALHSNGTNLFVCGEKTIEAFQNVGGAGFPFVRIPGGLIHKGVKAKRSIITYGDGFAFVGGGENEQPSVYMSSGVGSSRISTEAIDRKLRVLSSEQQEAIFCTVEKNSGGNFLNVHLPDETFVYDIQNSTLAGKKLWHKRNSKNEHGQIVNWRVNGIVTAYGKTLVTDNQSGRIGVVDESLSTEYGRTINRVVSTAPFNALGDRVNVSEIELVCDSGVGNIVSPGDDPVVSMSFSDDGGKSFGNQIDRKLGKIGNAKLRQVWRKQGQIRNTRVYRFVIDDTVITSISRLVADVE